MRIMLRFLALLVLMLGCALPAAPAQAQSRTWVSGVGDDGNACSRTAPCKTFAGAYAKTPAGGEIDCLDSGEFATLSINHGIIINCQRGTAGVSASGSTPAFSINTSDPVVLRGLDFNGERAAVTGLEITGASANVHVQNCRFRGFTAYAISALGGGVLTVEDSTITDNLSGVEIGPSAAASVSLAHVQIMGSTANGLEIYGGVGPITITVSITDSNISQNGEDGVIMYRKEQVANVTVDITHTILASNGATAVENQGSGAISTVTLRASTMTNNAGGAVRFFGNGALLTFGDNNMVGPNGTGFSGPIALQ